MCEKNFDGKVLSPPSNDDIDEETIVDDSVDNEIEEETIKPKKRKRRSRKAKKYGKICKTCNQDILENEMRDMLMYKNTYHQLQVKDYCKDHEAKYGDHKCKPHWCGDCDYLINYEIEIQKG